MSQIIDSDGHIVEPRSVWEEYTEPAFREQMIQVRRNRDGMDELFIAGENRSRPSLPITASMVPGGLEDLARARKLTWDDVLPGSYDPQSAAQGDGRRGHRCRGDVSVAVVALWRYRRSRASRPRRAAPTATGWRTSARPRPSGFMGSHRCRCRASTNRFARCVGWSRNSTSRRSSFGPIHSTEGASTIRLTIRSGARRRSWIFRSRCTEAFGTKMPTMGADRYRDPFFFHMVCHPFEQQAACMDIICGGVLAKFPGLKIAFLESGIGWLGYWLDRMDGHFEKMGTYVPWLKKPSARIFP